MIKKIEKWTWQGFETYAIYYESKQVCTDVNRKQSKAVTEFLNTHTPEKVNLKQGIITVIEIYK